MGRGTSIAGRKKNDGIDFYQTPKWCIEALLKHEKFSHTILEPCSGAGAISKVLEEHGYNVISQDLRTDNNVYGTKGIDFLDYHNQSGDIITNPPYCIAQDFIKHALSLSNGKVAMLLKLAFLESMERYYFFKSTPLRTVYVFCRRVSMYPEGEEQPKNSGTIAFAWYVWEKGYTGKPTIDWIQ